MRLLIFYSATESLVSLASVNDYTKAELHDCYLSILARAHFTNYLDPVLELHYQRQQSNLQSLVDQCTALYPLPSNTIESRAKLINELIYLEIKLHVTNPTFR